MQVERHPSGLVLRSWRQSRALVLIPLALIAVIMVVDVLSGRDVYLGTLLIVAPALTASFAGPRLVALIGGLAVAGGVVTAEVDGWSNLAEHETQIIALAAVSVLIVLFSASRERRQRQLARVRRVAEVAQHVLMRPLPERIGPLRIASLYLTAEQEARVGGDLYAAARIGCGTRLIIGDVRGKGLEAIDTAALVTGAFRAAAHQRAALADLLAFLDSAACFDPSRSYGDGPDSDECFVTALALDILDDDPTVRIANRGHPGPLLVRDDHVSELHARRPALPLGLGELSVGGNDVETFAFDSHDLLLLYTDGLIEARDSHGRFFPLIERVACCAERDPRTLIENLRDDLLTHVGGHLSDDAAVIAIERAR